MRVPSSRFFFRNRHKGLANRALAIFIWRQRLVQATFKTQPACQLVCGTPLGTCLARPEARRAYKSLESLESLAKLPTPIAFALGGCDFIREVQNIVVFCSAKVPRGVLSRSERRQ